MKLSDKLGLWFVLLVLVTVFTCFVWGICNHHQSSESCKKVCAPYAWEVSGLRCYCGNNKHYTFERKMTHVRVR
jgi:hypothetical protein